jgi:hypothetical protein
MKEGKKRMHYEENMASKHIYILVILNISFLFIIAWMK